MEWLVATLATLTGGVALALALVGWILARSARWRHLGLIGWISFFAAIFSFGSALSWIRDVPDAAIAAVTGRLDCAVASVLPAAWLFYSHAQYGEKVAAGSKVVAATSIAVAALSLIPGVVWTEAIHRTTSFGLTARHPVATRFGQLALLLSWAAYVAVLLRYATLVRTGRRGAWLHLISVGGLVVLGIHDAAVVSGWLAAPTLTTFAFGLLFILPLLAELTIRFSADAETLAMESQRLNDQVRRRTAELVDAREHLLRSERLTALGTLAASVGHEINNPLAAVIMNLEWSRETLEEDSEGQRDANGELGTALSEAVDAAKRIQRIVADLRIFARAQESPTASVQVPHLIETSLRLVANELRHRAVIETDIEGDLPPVAADETRLAQVLVNLLVNAGQAIPQPDGGAPQGLIRVTARTTGESVELVVEDNGDGMSELELRRVFEPFFTTKGVGEGSGLGLYVSLGIVRSFGGDIHVASVKGKGTRVTVVLRTEADVSPAHRLSSARTPVAPLHDVRVLVVDDDTNVARSLCRMLGDANVEFEISGAAALERMSRAAYDVVLCDLMLPTMTGMELYDEVRRRDSKLGDRFLFMTGGPLTDRARAFVHEHHDRVLSKPFSRGELDRRIRRRLTVATAH